MKRLSGRLVATHLAVALVAGAVTFVIVRLLATALFDRSFGMGQGMGRGRPEGAGMLRDQIAADVTLALLVGTAISVVVAALVGWWFARRIVAPLRRLSGATRQLAGGDYDVSVPRPETAELAQLADDISTLGSTLADTESRRVRLLGEVAHELRTPLTVIDGTVEAMIDGVLPVTPAALGGISDEVRRLRRLSDDLSALSRAEEGRLSVNARTIDLSEVVTIAAERLRPQAEDAGITYATPSPGETITVDADPDRVAQVVTNLVGNAIRATPPDGSVRVEIHRVGEWVEVTVTDSGVGLGGSDLERVFERFYRVPGAPRGETGSGVGLTIARALMRAMGGDLTASSDGPGRGARFTAWLPSSAVRAV